VKVARTLSAIGLLAALAGCRTCWIDRDDDRPMKYGSLRDCLSYGWGGECFHPKYHCGPPDGHRDHLFVKKAAVQAANRSLSEQDGGGVSRDFKYGYQQAYIDIANGGSGALPAVPPPRYWAAPYRTTWGHNKARDWFSGYQAGVCSAKCCMPSNTLTVPTSVYREGDHRINSSVGVEGYSATAVVSTNYGWANGDASYAAAPMMGIPNSMPASGGPMNVPAMSAPNPDSMTSGGWSHSPGPSLPSFPAPPPTVPAPMGGGHSIPAPGGEFVHPPTVPRNDQPAALPPAAQRGFSPSNPWSQFSGVSGFGFRPEGASR
jgi:hypothetical protein